MAIAFGTFASGVDSTTTATSLTISLSISVGDAVVVHCGRGGTQAIGTVTDNGSNTYTKQNSFSTATPSIAIFTTIATATATTITVNFTAGSKTSAVSGRYTGVASIGTNTGTNHAISTNPTITCTLANSANWAVAGLSNNLVSSNMTALTGNLRGRVSSSASTPSQSALVDNTGSTSVVCAVTIASSNWAAEFVELVPASTTGTFEDDSFNINGACPTEPIITLWQ